MNSQHYCCVQGQDHLAQPKPRGPPQRSPAPALSVSLQSLAAHAQVARQRESEEFWQALDEYLEKEYHRLVREEAEKEARKAQQGKGDSAPQQKQPAARAARPPPLVWEPAVGQAAPASAKARLRAAKASASAAAAWASTAAAREAAAAAAAERASSLPPGAEEWEWAAAAWQAAYAGLESARQACPDAPAVREAEAAVEAAIEAAAALRGAQQGWRGGDGKASAT